MKKFKKEVIDQAAHFSGGFAVTLALALFMPVIVAGLAVFGGALVREKLQHKDKKIWQLGKGSMLDLAFWLLGIGLAVGLKLSGIV